MSSLPAGPNKSAARQRHEVMEHSRREIEEQSRRVGKTKVVDTTAAARAAAAMVTKSNAQMADAAAAGKKATIGLPGSTTSSTLKSARDAYANGV
jgi:hypothetical protein